MKRLLIACTAVALLSGCETSPGPYRDIAVAPPAPVIDNPLTTAAEREAAAKFGGTALRPGDYRILPAAAIPAKGEVKVLVSLRNQKTYVYKAGQLIAISTSSHGTADHPTDPGQFKILQKKPFHRSNKYSNAPMPHMQRLDKWGRAFHGGVVPGYPASHGCIRLPPKMAKALYGLTKVGDVVEIEA
ncbi:L,D-transpeptidase family protein [Sphingomonas sp. HDW15A]|uniref:L,D-transpeptidase family protein n=1 Tax=Sphingomonas sp. HDW15A TaxID=2714942 RepID=UPI001407460A|nr:L,D-transpeptidase family protein [Sphingomonas sp. HDW15A]QIK96557.1 L,D-transpeptidase family protein [Sphingomonas sp. HDW15A]